MYEIRKKYEFLYIIKNKSKSLKVKVIMIY